MTTLQRLREAIAIRSPIAFRYNRQGKTARLRTGNPHAVYIERLKNGEERVYVDIWQTGGASDSNTKLPGWRRFLFDHLSDVSLLRSDAPFPIAKSYNPTRYSFPIESIRRIREDY